MIGWISTLEDVRKAVMGGTATEAQVRASVDRGCRLSGAAPADQAGHEGERQVWITIGEAMASNVAIVQHLRRPLPTQSNGGDGSP